MAIIFEFKCNNFLAWVQTTPFVVTKLIYKLSANKKITRGTSPLNISFHWLRGVFHFGNLVLSTKLKTHENKTSVVKSVS